MKLFGIGGKKKAAVKDEKPKKSSQFSGLSIGKIIWSGFLVITIITLLSGYSSYLLYAERVDQNHDEMQQAIADRAAAVFAAKLEILTSSIKNTLRDEEIQQALDKLSAEESVPPEALQKRLNEQLQMLIRQVIVSPSSLPDDALTPPLSYACLELPSLKKPVMELHRFGTKDQHLDIAFPISNGRSLILSFDTKLAHQWLKTINSGKSYINLQQQIGGNAPLTFGQTGNHRLAGNNASSQSIPGTQFQVSVSLPVIAPLEQTDRLFFFANFIVALVLIALTLSATLFTVRLILKKDLRTVSSLINRSQMSMHHILPIKLAELKGCAEQIKRQLGFEQGEKSDSETASNSDADEEISPLFSSDITVDVADDATKPTDEK